MEGVLWKKDQKKSYIDLLLIMVVLLVFLIIFLNLPDNSDNKITFEERLSLGPLTKYSFKVKEPKQMSSIREGTYLLKKNRISEMAHKENKLLEKGISDARVKKYIDINNQYEVNKVLAISENTPLDLYTSSIIVSYCKKFDIPVSLLLAVIELESNFNQYEVGKAMDRGYCQIIPSTEKWLATNYGHMLGIKYDPNKIFEPEYNIGLACLYLYNLKKAYKDNYHRILSEYNRGPYKLKRYYEKNKTYETTYSRVILNRQKKYINLFKKDEGVNL